MQKGAVNISATHRSLLLVSSVTWADRDISSSRSFVCIWQRTRTHPKKNSEPNIWFQLMNMLQNGFERARYRTRLQPTGAYYRGGGYGSAG